MLNQEISLIIFVCGLALACSTYAPENKKGLADFGAKSLECGEIYRGSQPYYIFYKPFQPILANERCVWIIAIPNAVGYNVAIEYLGAPTNVNGSGQELILTGVRPGSGAANLTSYLPETTDKLRVSDSNILIVTFISSSRAQNESSGFVLEFDGILNGNITRTNTSSTHGFLHAPTFEFKYPVNNASRYGDNELAVLVLTEANKTYSPTSKQILYKRHSLEDGCRDVATIYKLNLALSTKWETEGGLCSQQYHQSQHSNITLVIFQSDSSVVASGFWLYYLKCSG